MITATIIGRLGRDAEEVKAASPGISFSLASDQGWGEKRTTNWIRITLWGKRAEIIRPMLVKGCRVAVCGELQTNEYQGKSSLECKAYEVQILSERREQSNAPSPSVSHDSDPF